MSPVRGKRLGNGFALVVAFAFAVVGCSSNESSAPTTEPTPRWQTTESDGAVTVDTGAAVLDVELDPFAFSASRRDTDQPFFAQGDGLFLVRGGERIGIADATLETTGPSDVSFAATFEDGSRGTVGLAADGRDDTIAVTLRPDSPAHVTAWGDRLRSPDDELIYGLTERIVDDVLASEVFPEEVGSLDRKGEIMTMWVEPTMSGYVPFHQSSYGYGLLVDGFTPGVYDVGATDPGVLDFEFEWDPDTDTAGYHLFTGPEHAAIVDSYYDLTGRPPLPPDQVFLHWRGRDELPVGEPVEVDGVEMNATVARDLAAYEQYDLPAGIYHFDRPWAVGEAGYGELVFDPARFPDAEAMLELLEARGWHNQVWAAPWALGPRGDEAEELGYLAPNSDREAASAAVGVSVDLTNPAAVEWLQQDFLEFLAGPEGSHVDGFMLDRGDEADVSSTVDDVWADGRNGRQIHNWYPVEFARVFREVIDEARPDDGWLLARPGYTGSQAFVMRWGGDTHGREGPAIPEVTLTEEQSPSTDLGLRSVLISMQRAAFMGMPFWTHDIGGYNGWIDPEVYARWVEVGFASPLMRFHGQGRAPWDEPRTASDDELLDIYRRYVVLRHEMNDYLVATAEEAVDTGMPMVRPLVFVWPDAADARDRWDEWMLGDDLLVAPVWESGSRERSVWIPPGEWVDFWDHDTVVEGPTTIEVDVPLDVLPMWVPADSELLDLEIP